MMPDTTLIDAFAGATAGVFARTVVAPIDRIKLLIQLSGSIQSESSTTTSFTKSSPIQIFKDIIQKEGILSLWRGNTPTILIEGGVTALNFVFLNKYKALISNNVLSILEQHIPSLRPENEGGIRKRRILKSFVSGGLAGATTISILYPLGFMRTRLATDVGNKAQRMYPRGMRDVFKKIWQTDGVRGFYKGYGIALISVSMHRFVYLGGYDFIKSEYDDDSHGKQRMSLGKRFCAAQLVSMAASTIHYPLDCVRRRLMMEAGKTKKERKYNNTLHCFKRVLAEEGIKGFYLGLQMNLIRCVGSALVLVSYDELKRALT